MTARHVKVTGAVPSADSSVAVSVVTGAAGGIGLECARQLGARGPVLIADAAVERLEAAERELGRSGIDATGVVCDVTDTGSVEMLAQRASTCGPLGVLVHAAGVAPPLTRDASEILDVNLAGTARTICAFAEIATHGTAGVCVASVVGHQSGVRRFDAVLDDPLAGDLLDRLQAVDGAPLSGALAYVVSKRGVIRLCERQAREWGKRGARLMSISPSLVADTAIGAPFVASHADAIAERAALSRVAGAAEVAGAIVALSAAQNSYMTGCDVLVDGGFLAGLTHHRPDGEAAAWHTAGLGITAPP